MQGMKRPATSAGNVNQPAPATAAPRRERAALAAIWLSTAWVLVVASIKLFKGTPSDLPPMVQNFLADMDIGLKFQVIVGIELSVVALGLFAPRFAWPFFSGMFALFVAMLAKMISDGESSCGCFGGAIKFSPWAMLAIDGTCLAAILLTKPWSSLAGTRLRLVPLALAFVAAWAAPFTFFKNVQLPTAPPVVVTPPAPGTGPTAQDPSTPPPAPAAWNLPEPLPQFQTINPAKQNWLGKHLKETPVGQLVDVELFPLDATWILYRITCEHCAKEFQEIANDPERAAKLYVLVRIPEPDEEKYRQVHAYPPIFQEAFLPVLPRGYFGQTPWTLEVEGGVVKKVTAGEGIEVPGASSK